MSSGAEFSDHHPHAEDGRADEKYVRILFVEDRTDLADEIRNTLGHSGCGSFEIVRETSLVRAASQIHGDTFDLLLLDPTFPNVERAVALELADDLAHRLPVVVLTGTETLAGIDENLGPSLRACIERADIPSKLLSAIRRSRRLGTGVMAPIFCRFEEFCS